MQIQTKPFAGGLVAALYYLLVIVLALQLSCISLKVGVLRQQTTQMDYAVEVSMACNGEPDGTGSGVMIGGRYVLTARHVVEGCNGKLLVQVIGVLGAKEAQIDRSWPERDVVRLRMAGWAEDFWGVNRAVIAPLETRDVVCTAVKAPAPGNACGWIKDIYVTKCVNNGEWCHNIEFNAEVARGNSGGALYNSRGHLTALVTGAQFIPGTAYWFQNSYATSLWPIREEIYDE